MQDGDVLCLARLSCLAGSQTTRRWGTTHKACKEVIAEKKLILIDCDMEGLKMARSGGNDCLTIFLSPENIQVLSLALPVRRYGNQLHSLDGA